MAAVRGKSPSQLLMVFEFINQRSGREKLVVCSPSSRPAPPGRRSHRRPALKIQTSLVASYRLST
jgi:hypothetical protein